MHSFFSLFKTKQNKTKTLKKKVDSAEHFSSWDLVRMAGGASPHTTSCSSQGEWNLMKRYFRFGMGLEKWGGISGLSYLLPSLSEISHSIFLEVVKEMLGLSRNSLGNQSRVLRVGVLRLGEGNAIPEEEPQKCLNLSPFLPLLTSDLRVLGFLLSSFPPLCPSMGGKGCFG